MKYTKRAKKVVKLFHIDAYPHNCPACIYSKLPPGSEVLFQDHIEAVEEIRKAGKSG